MQPKCNNVEKLPTKDNSDDDEGEFYDLPSPPDSVSDTEEKTPIATISLPIKNHTFQKSVFKDVELSEFTPNAEENVVDGETNKSIFSSSNNQSFHCPATPTGNSYSESLENNLFPIKSSSKFTLKITKENENEERLTQTPKFNPQCKKPILPCLRINSPSFLQHSKTEELLNNYTPGATTARGFKLTPLLTNRYLSVNEEMQLLDSLLESIGNDEKKKKNTSTSSIAKEGQNYSLKGTQLLPPLSSCEKSELYITDSKYERKDKERLSDNNNRSLSLRERLELRRSQTHQDTSISVQETEQETDNDKTRNENDLSLCVSTPVPYCSYRKAMATEPTSMSPSNQNETKPKLLTTIAVTTKAMKPKKNNKLLTFKQQRENLSEISYKMFNENVFHNKLPKDLLIEWNPRLTRTAGQTIMRNNQFSGKLCSVQLSTKVIDNEQRLKSTLLHELCHVAQFLLENETRPPHGPAFQKWRRIAILACPNIPVTITHNYDIYEPHQYQCTQCYEGFGRHTKIKNLESVQCSLCHGSLEYTGHLNPNGEKIDEMQPQRILTPYNRFIKQNYAKMKQQHPCSNSSELMTRLAAQWKEISNSNIVQKNENEIITNVSEDDQNNEEVLKSLQELTLNNYNGFDE